MIIFWHQGPQEDTKSTEWTQPRQTLLKRMESTWENWHGQPQKYETTLLGRQRTGSRLTYLRRGENTASQLKRHGKHIGKPTRKAKNTKPTTRKSHWGLEPVLSQQGSQRQRTKGNPFKKDGKHLRHKEHRRDGNKANQLMMRIFWHQGPQRRHKEHRMDTTKANPFEKNGKHLGKLTRQPQKYETTLLGQTTHWIKANLLEKRRKQGKPT